MSWWPCSSSRRLGADDRFAARQQLRPTRLVRNRCNVERLTRRAHMLLEGELPPADVVPPIELVADAAIDANGLEPHRLVQRDARRIRQRDAGERIEVALRGKDGEQRRVEAAADVSTTMVLGDVHRGVD